MAYLPTVCRKVPSPRLPYAPATRCPGLTQHRLIKKQYRAVVTVIGSVDSPGSMQGIGLSAWYAMLGTDQAYGARRCVLTERMVLGDVDGKHALSYYAPGHCTMAYAYQHTQAGRSTACFCTSI
eukprot:3312025-Rhodomonas_salina.1